jgi:hypothetical protein
MHTGGHGFLTPFQRFMSVVHRLFELLELLL